MLLRTRARLALSVVALACGACVYREGPPASAPPPPAIRETAADEPPAPQGARRAKRTRARRRARAADDARRPAAALVRGRAVFQGSPPTLRPLMRDSDPVCAALPMMAEDVLVRRRGLANVFVRITGDVPGSAPREGTVDLRFHGCMYRPRVLGGVVGQKLLVRNEDRTLQNLHSYPEADGARQYNRALVPGSPAVEMPLEQPGRITFRCDVHPWEIAHLWVSSHAYFATTDEEGRFVIPDVPAGTHTLEAWHERLGTHTRQITTGPGEATDVELVFGPEGESHGE